MTKAKISQYDAVAANNTDVNGVNIAENCPPSGMNNMGREIMAALKRFQTGSDSDGVTVGGNLVVSGTSTLSTTSISSADINAGTIDGTAIGGASAAAGSFTTLNTSGQVVFNDAGADVDFRVEGDTDANLLFVDASTDRVGIGTNSPASKLDVTQSGATRVTVISTNNDASGSGVNFLVKNGGTTVGNGTIRTDNSDNLSFFNIAGERMRIDSSGNLLVGTTSSLYGFAGRGVTEINGSSSAICALKVNNSGAGYLFHDGTNLNLQQVLNNSLIFSTNNAERARITSGGYFKASNNGSYVNATSSFHEFASSENNVSLIVTSTNASFAASCLEVFVSRDTTNGTYNLIRAGLLGVAARFIVADSGNVTNTNNSYGQISDIKTKQDIVDAGSQWDDIKNIRVRKFRFKTDPTGPLQIGVVAQELEEVSPGLIDERPDYEQVTRTREVEKTRVVTEAVLDEDGNEIEPAVTETYTEEEEYTESVALDTTTKSVKYSVLYMKAVKALQEAIERIETLEAKVAALEAK